MIEIKKEELLKETIDYEEYTENVYRLTVEDLRKEGLLKCGGCCMQGENKKGNCSGCKSKNSCKK